MYYRNEIRDTDKDFSSQKQKLTFNISYWIRASRLDRARKKTIPKLIYQIPLSLCIQLKNAGLQQSQIPLEYILSSTSQERRSISQPVETLHQPYKKTKESFAQCYNAKSQVELYNPPSVGLDCHNRIKSLRNRVRFRHHKLRGIRRYLAGKVAQKIATLGTLIDRFAIIYAL